MSRLPRSHSYAAPSALAPAAQLVYDVDGRWSTICLSVGETNLKLWNPCHPSPPPSASVTDRGEKCKALHDRSLQRGCARVATTTAGRNRRTAEQPDDARARRRAGWNTTYSSSPPVRPKRPPCPLSEWRNERTDEGKGGAATYFCITFRGTAAPFHLSNMNALQRASRARRARQGWDLGAKGLLAAPRPSSWRRN